MNTRIAALAALAVIWAASLAGAYRLGRGSSAEPPTVQPPPAPEVVDMAPPASTASPSTPAETSAPTDRVSASQILRDIGPDAHASASEPPFSATNPFPLRRALQNNDPILRAAAFSRILEQLDADNIEAAVKEFDAMPPGFDRGREFNLLLYAWGRIDGAAALAYLEERGETRRAGMGRGAERMGAFSVMSGWASTDPDGALAWLSQNQTEDGNSPLVLGIINGIAPTNLQKASEIMYDLPLGWQRNRAADMLIDHYLQQGTGFTTRWAENLPSGELKSGILSRVAGRLADADPAASADWVLSLSEGEEKEQALTSLVQQWSRQDPAKASEWVDSLSSPELKAQGYRAIVDTHLRRRDVAAATAFVNQRNPGPELDPAIGRLAQWLRRSDPPTALSWAAAVSNNEQRFALMDEIVKDWSQRDPEAARAFLGQSR